MSTIDEIKILRSQGKSEQDIVQALKQKGLSQQEISSVLSQAQIKDAVSGPQDNFQSTNQQYSQSNQSDNGSYQQSNIQNPPYTEQYSQPPQVPPPSQYSQSNQNQYQQSNYQSTTQEMNEMSPSIMSSPPQQADSYPVEDPYNSYNSAVYQGYDSYQPSSGVSTDTINEIAESVVSEKLSSVVNKMEKIVDFKNTFETKISNLDERLKKIEKTIDVLQRSILEKVGEHMTSVSDLKKELLETQKTFKSVTSGNHKSHSHETHHKHKK